RFHVRELARELTLRGSLLTREVSLLARVFTLERGLLARDSSLLPREFPLLVREFGGFMRVRRLLRGTLRGKRARGETEDQTQFFLEHVRLSDVDSSEA